MTEEINQEKSTTKRRRRSKKAAAPVVTKETPSTPVEEVKEEAAEKEIELNFGSSYEKEIDAIIEEEVVAKAPEPAPTPEPEPIPEPKPAPVVSKQPERPQAARDKNQGLTQSLYGIGKIKYRMRNRRNGGQS